MSDLQGKTILLLTPKFFGYEVEIKKELEKLGATVIYFDERPKNDFLTKVYLRLNLKYIIKNKIDKYYSNIKKEIENIELDYIFLLNVEAVPLKFIEEVMRENPSIKIFTYFWDSVSNRKQSLKYLKYSTSFYSFDFTDSILNEKINFLPLFYIKDYKNLLNCENEIMYDVCFIGTVHSDRYKIVKNIEKQLKKVNIKTYFYFYSPSKILFFFQKIFKTSFRLIEWKDVSFEPLRKSDLLDVISKSKSIIDIQHPLQTGLTMRTIEILGAKKKLFTTNIEVNKYDFYNKSNICIINRNNPELNFNFFTEEYKEIDSEIYEKYSLYNWLNTIFRDIDEKNISYRS